jgi:hypothetical protein
VLDEEEEEQERTAPVAEEGAPVHIDVSV